ncbi:ribonuclease III [Limnochorda pilosa]|uniref:Ribonuclease 3 n=1 Tax=Limnochorda pilosa TaxID=1555112 RepID=A0A0K2SK22_LIMPI|nr:ribonuclease III [Limnochorda pilosa]BAS27466.1 ribonuclease III [Limnochorda pilosa]
MAELARVVDPPLRRLELLDEAMTHRSYGQPPGRPRKENERLEFLGDAVLGLAIADRLFHQFPDLPVGRLAQMRIDLVRAPVLAEKARSLDLGRHLRLGHGEAASGGRQKESLVGDALEALIGAIYLERGWETAARWVEGLFDVEIAQLPETTRSFDAKSRLQERTQERGGQRPEYRLVEVSGPDHDRSFRVEVWLGGQLLGRGAGRSKKAAEQEAAHRALEALGAEASSPEPAERGEPAP